MKRVGAAVILIATFTLVMTPTTIGRQDPTYDWTTRLESLRPEDPVAYFELAEEMADVAGDDETRRVARRLFALAGALDPAHLGRSACLALADVETDGTARRRLLALASLLGGGPLGGVAGAESNDPGGVLGGDVSMSAVLAVTESFSYYRRGEGPRALNALRRDGATELLTAYEWLLPGGIHRYVEDARLYRGRLRPSISDDDLERMLEFEVALLAGADRPWSSDLLLSRGRPLIEVDPDQIAGTLGANPARPYFRDGRWVAVE